MNPVLRKALLAAAYAAAVALFFEGASRAALSSDGFFRRVAGNDEASWRLRWVKRQKGQRRIYYAFDDYHPSRGWTLRPGLRGVQAFPGKKLSSNTHGLRGAREYAYDRPSGAMGFLFSHRHVFGSSRHDKKLSGVDPYVSLAQTHEQPSAHHQK